MKEKSIYGIYLFVAFILLNASYEYFHTIKQSFYSSTLILITHIIYYQVVFRLGELKNDKRF